MTIKVQLNWHLKTVINQKSKHIDIRVHFLIENIVKSKVKFKFVKSCYMVADNLTKVTTLEKHLFCISKMGLRSISWQHCFFSCKMCASCADIIYVRSIFL